MNKRTAVLATFLAVVFASLAGAGVASAQSARTLKGQWNDGQYSGSLQFSFQDSWEKGLLELWCQRGGTRVDFVLKSQSGEVRAYEVVKDSWPNNCGVESFTIRSNAKGGGTATLPPRIKPRSR